MSLMNSYHLPFTLPDESKHTSKILESDIKGLSKESVIDKIVKDTETTDIKVEKEEDEEDEPHGARNKIRKVRNVISSSESESSDDESSNDDQSMGKQDY